ncbi:MAG: major capsid protein [Rhodospirillales bacterium]|nr:major capsid protein [Rhodospirillales bacterium]
MPNIIDVFSGDAFGVREMTDAINFFPYQYGLINSMGLFDSKGVATTSVAVEINKGVLNLISSKPRGVPSTKNVRGKREMRYFEIPHIPAEDRVLPSDNELPRRKQRGIRTGRVAYLRVA